MVFSRSRGSAYSQSPGHRRPCRPPPTGHPSVCGCRPRHRRVSFPSIISPFSPVHRPAVRPRSQSCTAADCQKFLLDALGQSITGDEAVETGFLPQSIFQICHLQEQLPLRLIQQTGELPVCPFNLPVQILRPPGCRLEPAAKGFHIVTHDVPPQVWFC